MNELVSIRSSDFWVKVVEMLQQNWALVEDEGGAARVYFISDAGGVFDELAFPSPSSASEALGRNGFRRLVDSTQWLSERLGQQFVIENRPGAGGNLATDAVVKAPPDGYTLLLTNSGDAWNPALYGDLKFNYIRDIVPVASVSREIGVLVVHPSVPLKSVSELIAYAKANPGKLTMASSGVGSAPHMYWELFRSMSGVDMLHVPYRGGGPALTDLLGAQVQVMFATMPSSIQYIRDGKLRPLAVTASTRADVLPDIPTVGEFVRGYDASTWTGVGAPKNTPMEIVTKLNTEISAGAADAGMKMRFAEFGDAMFASSPADFAKLIAEDTEKWAKVIKLAGIKPD